MGCIPWESILLENFNISPIAVLILEYEEGAARYTQYEYLLRLDIAELLRVLLCNPLGDLIPILQRNHTL